VVRQAGAICRSLERKNGLQFPAELERDFGCDLIGSVSDGRDKLHPWRKGSKTIAVGGKQRAPCVLDSLEDVSDSFSKNRNAVFGKHLGAMASHTDREHERDSRGAGRCAGQIALTIFVIAVAC
jgi:hypothetical protein